MILFTSCEIEIDLAFLPADHYILFSMCEIMR